jgi:hypothetical protein
VRLGHVRADHEDDFGVLEFTNAVGHCARTEAGRQTGDRGGVSCSGTVIDIVGLDHRPGEFGDSVLFRW